MDPVAHTLFGAALAESALKNRSRYATATLLLTAGVSLWHRWRGDKPPAGADHVGQRGGWSPVQDLQPSCSTSARRMASGDWPNQKLQSAIVCKAMASPSIRGFMNWARFPYWTVEESTDHWTVKFQDLRYKGPDEPSTPGVGFAKVEIPK